MMEPKDIARFICRVIKTNNCWLWTGTRWNGYGKFRLNGKSVFVHRISHELFKGDIPDGLVIDHLCRNTLCVNPEHLEAVTQKVNCERGLVGIVNASKTHCKHGHEYDQENTYHIPTGGRQCRACNREWMRAHY